MFEAIREAIRQYDRIIIHRHTNPDGDALGSQIGLKHLIRENYPEKEVLVVGDPAGRYAFMEDSVMDTVPDGAYTDALAIVLDTSAPALISDTRYTTAAHTARIDHHLFLSRICQDEVVDTTYESCCGLVAELARESGWKLTPVAAASLYTGMVTDSGRFRYDSTTSHTFLLASYLTEQPFSLTRIYSALYADDLEKAKLRARFTLKIALTEHRVAYIYTTQEEVDALPLDAFGISRGMVGTMGDMKGVNIWVNFTESNGQVLCEIRSATCNINPIAVKYGGGGHAKASGATLKNREEAMALLRDLDEMEANAHE